CLVSCFFFQAEDGIRDFHVTGVQTCALPIFSCCLGSRPTMLQKRLYSPVISNIGISTAMVSSMIATGPLSGAVHLYIPVVFTTVYSIWGFGLACCCSGYGVGMSLTPIGCFSKVGRREI